MVLSEDMMYCANAQSLFTVVFDFFLRWFNVFYSTIDVQNLDYFLFYLSFLGLLLLLVLVMMKIMLFPI